MASHPQNPSEDSPIGARPSPPKRIQIKKQPFFNRKKLKKANLDQIYLSNRKSYLTRSCSTTSDNTENNAPIDEAIADYLSKKPIIDQTEQQAIARISSKTQTSFEQTEKSLEGLLARDWIRKYKMRGKIIFELAPKGRIALEALAKARRERVTNQLQQAIQQQQKAKQRAKLLSRMESIEDNWKDYQVPDKDQIGRIERDAETFLETVKQTQAKQPQCHINPENYEEEFLVYKAQIEKLTGQNSSLCKVANNYTQIKPVLLAISSDSQKISRTIAKHLAEPEVAFQINKLKTLHAQLKQIQAQLETFGNDQLTRMEELKTRLAENSKTLDVLKKSTHEFTIVKRLRTTERTLLYPDPEIPTIADHQTTRTPMEEQCVKCGAKRKSTPINIG